MRRYSGYSRKHRKARRVRRSQKSFGSADVVHSERGNSAAANAVVAAAEAARAAESGSCAEAVKKIGSAYGWYGHAVAHSQAGGRGIVLGTVDTSVHRAREVVISRCVRKGKGR